MLVNTGDGKGKSTAAFGVVLRGVARDWRVAVVQFLKSGKWNVGEEKVGRDRLGVDWCADRRGLHVGLRRPHRGRGRRRRRRGATPAALIEAGEHQLVVLDEITYPMNWGWIDDRRGRRHASATGPSR